MHVDQHAVVLQFVHHVDHPRVAQVRAVLLERQPEHEHPRAFHLDAFPDHRLDQLARHIGAHPVVQAPAGEDDLGAIADRLGLVGKVIGIDPDAVAADETGAERQEVPLRTRRLEHRLGVYPHAVEDDRQLVDECDVEVALGVLDYFGRLGHLDALGAIGAGGDDGGIERVDPLGRFGGRARDDLADGRQAMLAIARIDPLGRIADGEIAVET